MRIMIVSDSHGRCNYLESAYKRVAPVDMILHLGDLEGDAERIRAFAECPFYCVSGNNDFFSPYQKELIFDIGKYTVMMTHGHRYGVNYGTSVIKEAAKEKGADIVMFGHTHCPLIDTSDDVWAINPGSISLPRQTGRIPSFMMMEIDRFGEAHFTLQFESNQ